MSSIVNVVTLCDHHDIVVTLCDHHDTMWSLYVIIRFDIVVVYGSFLCLCVEAVLLHSFQHEPDWLKYLVIVKPLTLIR